VPYPTLFRSLPHPVAEATLRHDGAAAQLGPQPADMRLDGVAFDLIAKAVKRVLHLGTADCDVWTTAEALQQRPFAQRQVNGLTVQQSGTSFRQNGQTTKAALDLHRSGGAAMNRQDTGTHLVKVVRLNQVIIGPGLQPRD